MSELRAPGAAEFLNLPLSHGFPGYFFRPFLPVLRFVSLSHMFIFYTVFSQTEFEFPGHRVPSGHTPQMWTALEDKTSRHCHG